MSFNKFQLCCYGEKWHKYSTLAFTLTLSFLENRKQLTLMHVFFFEFRKKLRGPDIQFLGINDFFSEKKM